MVKLKIPIKTLRPWLSIDCLTLRVPSCNPCKNEETWAIRGLIAKTPEKGGAQAMKEYHIGNQMRKLLEQEMEGYVMKEFLRLSKKLRV